MEYERIQPGLEAGEAFNDVPECTICLEAMGDVDEDEENRPLYTLRCNHRFHKSCVHKSFSGPRCKFCPLCRSTESNKDFDAGRF